MSNLPVLVLGFNRPDLLQNLLNRLKDLEVTDVYISLDGPRNSFDSENCDNSLKVAQAFAPTFNTRIIHRTYNLGCNLGVVSALDWFFSQVEFGVVIEDDCDPADDLFSYFQRFKEDKEIFQELNVSIATGHNPFLRMRQDTVSRFTLIGAWATWAEVWQKIRLDYFKIKMPKTKNLLNEKRNLRETVFWWVNSTRSKLGQLDTWDGIFSEQAWSYGFKSLIPMNNLVTNLGFRQDGTHTKNSADSNLVQFNDDGYLDLHIDDLLVKYYYRIKRFHSVTPLLRLLIGSFRFLRPKQFEIQLMNDQIKRKAM
jgi:hypothetical protein